MTQICVYTAEMSGWIHTQMLCIVQDIDWRENITNKRLYGSGCLRLCDKLASRRMKLVTATDSRNSVPNTRNSLPNKCPGSGLHKHVFRGATILE